MENLFSKWIQSLLKHNLTMDCFSRVQFTEFGYYTLQFIINASLIFKLLKILGLKKKLKEKDVKKIISSSSLLYRQSSNIFQGDLHLNIVLSAQQHKVLGSVLNYKEPLALFNHVLCTLAEIIPGYSTEKHFESHPPKKMFLSYTKHPIPSCCKIRLLLLANSRD